MRGKFFLKYPLTVFGVFVFTGLGFGLSVNDVKYSAGPIAAAICYANKQYQDDKGRCEIKLYVSDKNFNELLYVKIPTKIKVIKDGVDKDGFRWYIYSLYKNRERQGGGIVMIKDSEIKNFNFSDKYESKSEIKYITFNKGYNKMLSQLKTPIKIE